jgi:predicted nucleic acid-binding protein
MLDSKVLVDTSAWIFALRKDFLPVVKERLDSLLKEDLIVTTGIIKLEILGGTKRENEFKRLKSRLDSLDLIESDRELWESSYQMAFNLRRKGITVPYTDILIAACAKKTKATLLHADSHFDMISGETGIQVESYVNKIKQYLESRQTK